MLTWFDPPPPPPPPNIFHLPTLLLSVQCHQSSPPADLSETPHTPVQVFNAISPLHQQTYLRLHTLLSKSSMPSVLSTSRPIRDSTHSCPSLQCHQSSPPADLSETPHTPVQVFNAISPLHQQTYPRLHTLLSKSSMPSVLSTSRPIRDSTHSCPSLQCHQSSPPADLSETPHTPVQVFNAISPLHQQTYPRLHTLLSKSSMPSVLSTSRPIRDSTHSCPSLQCHQSSPPADLSETPHTPVQVFNAISPLHQQTYLRLHTLLSKSSMPSVLSTSRPI